MIDTAGMSDADGICGLVNYYAERGRMLHRSLESVYESLRDFVVCSEDGQVVGCAALSISWKDLAEIRSLAVAERRRGEGIGRRLVESSIEQARARRLRRRCENRYLPV